MNDLSTTFSMSTSSISTVHIYWLKHGYHVRLANANHLRVLSGNTISLHLKKTQTIN